MSNKIRSSKRADSQIDFLIKYMANNREFASGRFQGADGKRKQDDQWEELAQSLNELGTSKTADQWKKMWRNDKACARKKNAELKKYLNQTGNNTNQKSPELSERERLIISIIGRETSEGIGVGEAGFGQATIQPDVLHNDNNYEELIQTVELEEPIENGFDENIMNEQVAFEVSLASERFKRPLDNDVPTSLPKIFCSTSRSSAMHNEGSQNIQTKRKESKVEKYSELVKDTNDGLKDISLAIKENSKALNIMAEAFTAISQQFERMNNIFEHYVLSNTVPNGELL